MRARSPDIEGFVEREGVALGYEVFGSHLAGTRPTVLLMPTWTIVHSRIWKLQVPYLARHFRVITYDAPGNGRSDRSTDPARYVLDQGVLDAAAILDACDAERAVVVALSMGAGYSLRLASKRPDLVAGLVIVAGSLPLAVDARRVGSSSAFHDPAPESPTGWERYNLAYWHAHYEEFVDWFFHQCLSEPHSTRAHEDAVGWALDTCPEVLAAVESKPPSGVDVHELLASVGCPMLWLHGDDDRVQPHAVSAIGAAETNSSLVTFAGSGHLPNLRDPVRFNLVLREFAERVTR